MKQLLGLVALFAVVMILFGRVPASIQQQGSPTDIAYKNQQVQSNDLFFGIHVPASSDGSIQAIANAGYAGKKSFWQSLFGGWNTQAVTSRTDPIVASVQNTFLNPTIATDRGDFVSPCEVKFTDIAGHVHEVAIRTAAQYCLVDGYSQSRFYPDNHIRRDELSKIVVNMMLLKLEGYVRNFAPLTYQPYDDVALSNVLSPYISYVTRLGVWQDLFADSTRRTFSPKGYISSADLQKLMKTITTLYPSYVADSTLQIPDTVYMTRGQAVLLLLKFFWGGSQPQFRAVSA